MGIEGFSIFLKSFCPTVQKSSKLSLFKGKRIAIDGHNWMVKHMAVAQKNVVNSTDVALEEIDHSKVVKFWLHSLASFISNIVAVGVTPIFVIDGDPINDKQLTRQKRREQKEKAKQKLADIQEKMEKMDPTMVTSNMIEEKRKYLRQMFYINSEDIESLRDVLYALGIPNIKSKNDAEKLCSSLCIEGKAAAVLSTDSDNLTFGCPVLIKEINNVYFDIGGEADANITLINLDDVLNESGLSFNRFMDFCILSGCDYNEKIKGIGPKTAYNKIKEYGNLSNFLKVRKEEEIKKLNIYNCKKHFCYDKSEKLLYEGEDYELDIDLMKTVNYGSDILDLYELRSQLNRIIPFIHKLPRPTNQESYNIQLFVGK